MFSSVDTFASLGVDMERIARFDLPIDDPFVTKCFTSAERAYAYSSSRPAERLCGMFCAKEAVLKVLRSGNITDIEIIRRSDGSPRVLIEGNALAVEISISHSGDYAIAVAIKGAIRG